MGSIKESEDAMKNRMIVILTLLVIVGAVGYAFANPTDESRYPATTVGPIAVHPGSTGFGG